jgi:hypothetical protein
MDTLHPAASGLPPEERVYPTSHSFKADKDMQADLARLDKACSEPERFVTSQGAQTPISV